MTRRSAPADGRQVRSQASAATVDPVTPGAGGPFVDQASGGRITLHLFIRPAQRSDIGDDLPHLLVGEPYRRHAGTGNAVQDVQEQRAVAVAVAQDRPGQVRAAVAGAVEAVAACAAGKERGATRRDVLGRCEGVVGGAPLCVERGHPALGRERTRRRQHQDTGRDHRLRACHATTQAVDYNAAVAAACRAAQAMQPRARRAAASAGEPFPAGSRIHRTEHSDRVWKPGA